MARKTVRPLRVLVAFFIVVAALYGGAALTGTWKPALGLDLEGGTRITLTATGNYDSTDLEQARQIIENRVNGSGVTEAQVTTQGGKYVIVEVPGPTTGDLVQVVTRQAQLRFRLVACSDSDSTACATSTTTTPSASASGSASATPSGPTAQPGVGVTLPPSPTASASSKPTTKSGATSKPSTSTKPSAAPSSKATGSAAPRPAPAYAVKPTAKPSATPSAKASAKPTATPSATPLATPSATPSATATTTGSAKPSPSASASPTATSSGAVSVPPQTSGGAGVGDQIAWQTSPDQASIDAYNNFTCPATGSVNTGVDDPAKPLVTCGTGAFQGEKFLLSSTVVEGTEVTKATSGIQQGQVQYEVDLTLNSQGRKTFASVSSQLAGTGKLFAIVLDGQIISAANFQSAIPNGQAQITGGFTQQSAASLATSLKYGALPIRFQDSMVETVGPSLAGDQLSAGITAGIIGLILVMLYCMLYYRGLGLVVVSSLLVAGAVTYAMVLILSKGASFSLSLPGIAGLIVAVGITADSFIVFFERIRDEMRDGKSMRVAVEAGWARARNTCVAADTVSLLAAVVLYIFAAGAVKGFAFTLGLSTVIDLAIFFFFTHPLVSTLARYRFFNSGHRLSGLNAETLGVDRIVGGRA